MLFLDTETTGLYEPPLGDLVEVGLVDEAGRVVLQTLVNPGMPIPNEARAIHGITDAMVRGQDVVVYNAKFDTQFFPGLAKAAAGIHCAMERFAEWRGEWGHHHGNYHWVKLGDGARTAGWVQLVGAGGAPRRGRRSSENNGGRRPLR